MKHRKLQIAFSAACGLACVLLLALWMRPADEVPQYDPETFRADLGVFINEKRYAGALAYLRSADAKLQATHDKSGYLAIGEDTIVLPSVSSSVQYDQQRDWLVPGTQDAIQDGAWQQAATDFAGQYNRARDAGSPR